MRYNRGMIETPGPLAPERRATVPAPDPAPLLEQLATLWLENAALRAENAALPERIRDLEARRGRSGGTLCRDDSRGGMVRPASRWHSCCWPACSGRSRS